MPSENADADRPRPELRIHPARMLAVIDHIEFTGKPVGPEPLSTEGYTDPEESSIAVFYVIKANYGEIITEERMVFSL